MRMKYQSHRLLLGRNVSATGYGFLNSDFNLGLFIDDKHWNLF